MNSNYDYNNINNSQNYFDNVRETFTNNLLKNQKKIISSPNTQPNNNSTNQSKQSTPTHTTHTTPTTTTTTTTQSKQSTPTQSKQSTPTQSKQSTPTHSNPTTTTQSKQSTPTQSKQSTPTHSTPTTTTTTTIQSKQSTPTHSTPTTTTTTQSKQSTPTHSNPITTTTTTTQSKQSTPTHSTPITTTPTTNHTTPTTHTTSITPTHTIPTTTNHTIPTTTNHTTPTTTHSTPITTTHSTPITTTPTHTTPTHTTPTHTTPTHTTPTHTTPTHTTPTTSTTDTNLINQINQINKTKIVPEGEYVNLYYNSSVVPVFNLGNYGIAPWGNNNNFIDKTAQWIWYSSNGNSVSSNNSVPITIQYVYTNSTKKIIDASLYMMVDNNADVLLNKNYIKKNVEGGWNGDIPFIKISIYPGENLFEFKVKSNGGPGGLLVSCISSNSNHVLFNSNSSWKFIPLEPVSISNCNLSIGGLVSSTDKYFPWGSLNLHGLSSQYVNLGTTITGMNGLTFGCWFKSNNNKDFTRIFELGNGVNMDNILLYIYNGKIGVTIYIVNSNSGDKINISENINNNTWNHIVWTLQPTQTGAYWIIYLNNKVIYTGIGVYPINLNRTECYLGKSTWTNISNFNGSISNFVMYQKVLSISEINALYNSMINTLDSKLYLFLPFSTNSVLDTLLNNYANKTFNLPIIKSDKQNQNWNCMQEGSDWYSVRMNNNTIQCMSMDGKSCVGGESEICKIRNSNPVLPEYPVSCAENQSGWCSVAKKFLSSKDIDSSSSVNNNKINNNLNNTGTSISKIKPGIQSLSALTLNQESETIGYNSLNGVGQLLSISNINDINNLLVGGTFKLKVNLPMMPPYIKGKNFDTTVGTNPNYFYLSIEQLDNNCNIINSNGKCLNVYVDNKNCSNKPLSSYVQNNSYRLVLISSQYALDPSIPMGKNSDFTLVQVNGQYYLKNVQTGYIPSLYTNMSNISIYGDMQLNANTNINNVDSLINNTLCGQVPVKNESTGYRHVKCNIPQDPSTYLIVNKNFGQSSPVRININHDKTISFNLLSFNSYGYPTMIYALTYCNFNVQTFSYIEKMTNSIGTFLVNLVCFSDSNNPNTSKNLLKFDVELISFPLNFVKQNSIYDIN